MIDLIGVGKKNNTGIYAIINIVCVIVIVALVVKIYKAMKAGTQTVGNDIGNQVISAQTGVQAARVALLRQLAIDLNTPIGFYWFTNTIMFVKDAEFVAILNKVVSANEAVLLSQFYKESKGISLKSIIESDHLDTAGKNSITYRTSFV